jgi:2'-5' RNA ligase
METFSSFLAREDRRAKTHEYSCVMVDVPDAVAREVKAFGRKIPDGYVFRHPDQPGYGREQDPHITLLYGIHTEKSTRVRKLVRDVETFQVALGKVSLFTTSSVYDVLKIEVAAPALTRLNKMLRDSLYCTQSFHEYSPHMTVAYLEKGRGEKYDGDDRFKGKTFEATHLIFSSSAGTKTRIKLKLGGAWAANDH